MSYEFLVFRIYEGDEEALKESENPLRLGASGGVSGVEEPGLRGAQVRLPEGNAGAFRWAGLEPR